MSTLKDSIARIGGLLTVVDAWDIPTAEYRTYQAIGDVASTSGVIGRHQDGCCCMRRCSGFGDVCCRRIIWLMAILMP
jgi:hypothetical protein